MDSADSSLCDLGQVISLPPDLVSSSGVIPPALLCFTGSEAQMGPFSLFRHLQFNYRLILDPADGRDS